MGQVIGQACRRRLVALNVAIVTFDLHRISPYICLLFQDQMIYDLHEMLFYSTHDMLSDAITFTSYDMTPSILSYIRTLYEYFVCHASLSGPNDLLWWDFFYAHAFFPGTNMPHEWNDYMNEMTSISFFYGHAFFSRNQHATWMKWLPIWHDYITFHSMPFSKV